MKKPRRKKVEKKEEKPVVQIKPRANLKVKKSALDDELKEIRKIKLETEKEQMKEELFNEIK